MFNLGPASREYCEGFVLEVRLSLFFLSRHFAKHQTHRKIFRLKLFMILPRSAKWISNILINDDWGQKWFIDPTLEQKRKSYTSAAK